MKEKQNLVVLKNETYKSIMLLRGWNGCITVDDVIERLLFLFDKKEEEK